MWQAETTAPSQRRNLRIYLTGLAFSLIGDSAMTLVAGIWVKSLTGSSSAAALVAVCVYTPSLLGPIAGLVADRVPLRLLLVATNLVAGGCVAQLLWVRGETDAWLIYLVMSAYGVAAVLIDPAENVLFTAIVAPDARAGMNGLRLTLQEGGKLIAPLAGAALYAAFGGGAVAALDAGTFLIAAVAVLLLRLPSTPPEPTPLHWRQDVAAGFRHVRHTPGLARVVLLAAVAMAVSGVVFAAQYDLVAAVHRPPSFLGVLTGALGAGSIVAGLLSGPMIKRVGELGLVAVGLVDAALGSLARASATNAVAAVAGSVVLGFALPWIVVATITMLQRSTPQHLQGRVSAAVLMALFAPQPVMQAAGAGLIEIVDFRLLYLGAAALQLGLTAWTVRRAPSWRARPDRDG